MKRLNYEEEYELDLEVLRSLRPGDVIEVQELANGTIHNRVGVVLLANESDGLIINGHNRCGGWDLRTCMGMKITLKANHDLIVKIDDEWQFMDS